MNKKDEGILEQLQLAVNLVQMYTNTNLKKAIDSNSHLLRSVSSHARYTVIFKIKSFIFELTISTIHF